MKTKVIEIRREAGGRIMTSGQLLLVILFLTLGSLVAQTPPDLTPETAARLRRQIETGTSEEKRTALSEIRNHRSPTASAIALPALRDRDELVRASAVASVVFLPGPEAARALIPLLGDRAEFVRREAAYGLGEAGDKSATGGLIRLMQSDKVFEVRTAATAAVGRIGDSSALESLIAILRKRPIEDEEFLRRSAARSLGQIAQVQLTGDDAVITPQNFLPDKFKNLGPATAANPVPFSPAVDVLISVLRNNSESDDTRREAAYALGAIGDPRAVPMLQAAVSAADPYLAEIAREALLKIERRSKASHSDD